MKTAVKTFFSSLVTGKMTIFNNMAVIPIFACIDDCISYITLKQALEHEAVKISEVSEGGSVPELKVINTSGECVLLVDGEELVGAKQNRVLNTTILVGGKSEAVIPVSCTEQGRWNYRTKHFHHSDIIMSSGLRAKKSRSVSDSLRNCKEYRSNQHEIWDEIKDLENKAGAESETGAMKDSYQHKENDLEAYLGHFKHYPGQRGIVVMINGKIAGLDYISHAKAFSELHDILVRSYAMNAVLNPPNSLIKPGHFKKSAIKGFIKMAGQCASRRYESVGKGHDIRFTGETCTGSALVVDDHVIHASFFNGCNEL